MHCFLHLLLYLSLLSWLDGDLSECTTWAQLLPLCMVFYLTLAWFIYLRARRGVLVARAEEASQSVLGHQDEPEPFRGPPGGPRSGPFGKTGKR